MNQCRSKLLDPVHLPKAFYGINYKEGSIFYLPKKDLIDGEYYYGTCRNSTIAKWFEEFNVFKYIRIKFGNKYVEEINHPEDDDGFDCFIPLYVCFPTEDDLINDDDYTDKKCINCGTELRKSDVEAFRDHCDGCEHFKQRAIES